MKNLITFTLMIISANVIAQKHDYIWLTGNENDMPVTLDFNYLNDSIYSNNRSMMLPKIYAVISDKDGHLLFYTNGLSIADSTHQMMQNGNGLNPGQIAQLAGNTYYPSDGAEIILPNPQKDSIYQLFHMGAKYYSGIGTLVEKVYHTTININLNNGKGGVIAKNQLLLADTLVSKLSAVQHGNGVDWWIISPELFTNGFYTFLLTKDSILGPFYQQIGPIYPSEWFAQNTFSPDGKKYVRYDGRNQLDLFNFDRCTGLLSNPLHIVPSSNLTGLGVAFSPNSRYLYASTNDTILQYDMLAPNITASADTVAVYDGYVDSNGVESYFYRMQLAPNGKIYINGSDNFHIIHSPDSAGVACNVEQRGLALTPGNYSSLMTPNYPHFRTGALVGSACDTLGVGVDMVEGEENWLRVYPNPTNHLLRVEWSKTNFDKGELMLLDALGRVVYQQKIPTNIQTIEVPTTQFPSGIYFCKVQLDKAIYTEKVVVVR